MSERFKKLLYLPRDGGDIHAARIKDVSSTYKSNSQTICTKNDKNVLKI